MPEACGMCRDRFDLSDVLETHRVLLVFTPDVQNLGYLSQKDVLDEQAAALADRDVVTIEVLGEDIASMTGATLSSSVAAQLRRRFVPDVGRFALILLGPDGREVFRTESPINGAQLLGIVDSAAACRPEIRPEFAAQA